MSSLAELKVKIDALVSQAEKLDQSNGESKKARFDSTLFQCQSRSITPYVMETRSLYQTLVSEQALGQLNIDNAGYLTERLIDQLNALTREITVKSNPSGNVDSPLSSSSRKSLYRDIAQHHEWERRLQELVLDKRNAVFLAPENLKSEAKEALSTTETRLQRCQAAIEALKAQLVNTQKKP